MPNASNLQPDGRFVGLFIGRSGSGKTGAECSFYDPDDNRKVKVWDFDGRIRGLLGCSWVDRSKIEYEYYPPKTPVGTKPNFQRLNEDFENLQALAAINQFPYQTGILDSLTSQTFALVCDALPLTHKTEQGRDKGKNIGKMQMPGPEDYGFEAQGTYQILAFLRSLPFKYILVSAHVVERYGKADPSNPFSESIPIGEKLSVRDKIGENIGIYFDHVFRFEKKMLGIEPRHYVQFRSDIARTTFESLPNGHIDITGKNFYKFLMEESSKPKATEQPKT